jgi:hypothetical protein
MKPRGAYVAATCSVRFAATATRIGAAGGVQNLLTTRRYSASPTTHTIRLSWKAERRSTSSRGGFEIALEQAKAAAGKDDVDIAGSAFTVRQALAAGGSTNSCFTSFRFCSGKGERLFDGAGKSRPPDRGHPLASRNACPLSRRPITPHSPGSPTRAVPACRVDSAEHRGAIEAGVPDAAAPCATPGKGVRPRPLPLA